jgi:hypothetical protein
MMPKYPQSDAAVRNARLAMPPIAMQPKRKPPNTKQKENAMPLEMLKTLKLLP